MKKIKVINFNLFYLLFIVFSAPLLQSCVGGAVTSAQVVYERNQLEKVYKDQMIKWHAQRKIYRENTGFENSSISIATVNRVVLLTGQVPTPELRTKLADIVKSVPDVKEVYNLTEVGRPTSALIQMSDAWLTAKVKSKLIANNDIDPDKIKVVTENGTVYLLGIVPREQADIATQLARTTDGVQHVVRIFSYITITRV